MRRHDQVSIMSNTDQVIHLYTLCWNEERILPFFLDHYRDKVDRILVYDNGSKDRSLEILANEPNATVAHFDTPDDSFVYEELRLSEAIWQASRGVADWVIILDMDEFLLVPNFRGYLSSLSARGVTAVRAVGFDMVSLDFPSGKIALTEQITRGFRAVANDKPCIFNPNAIARTNFTLGRHGANPEGEVRWPERPEMLLLHYKTLGWDYYMERMAILASGLKRKDIELGLGAHYLFTEEEHRAFFDRRWRRSAPVPGLSGGPPHSDLTLDEDIIHASGLFDRQWFLARYPQVAGSGYDPVSYYAFVGWRLDHDPSAHFRSTWYRNTYMDGAEANPLLHYIRHGHSHGFRTTPASEHTDNV